MLTMCLPDLLASPLFVVKFEISQVELLMGYQSVAQNEWPQLDVRNLAQDYLR